MRNTTLNRRTLLQGIAAGGLAMPAIGLGSRTVNAADAVQALIIRYPASEYYAEAMKKTPGVDVNVQLVPSDKQNELVNINLASGSANLDIIACNDTNLINYARNDWLRPLDDLWEKYKDEYGLGDIDEALLRASSSDGHLYQVPNEFNSHLQFYRKDVFEETGLTPAQSAQQLRDNAEALVAAGKGGVVLTFKVGDQGASAMTYFLNTVGDGWFDADWQPAFNSEKGIAAVEFMKDLTRFAQRGYATAGSEEGALALQQGFSTMGNMWATRASSMDNPAKSRFVGKFGFAVPGGGGQRFTVSGYSIPKFSTKDPDLLFRVMLESMREEAMRGNIANNVPTRASVLNDEALTAQYPYLVAAAGAAKVGKSYPSMPYFYPVVEIVTRRFAQVLTDEMKAGEAMNEAARETRALLTSNGFYKS
ncbi:MAG: extracellular solute-binding protein [Rhizobiaceae bacterium]|nr:extracellular solute-binding protein [Rhizobiaceae bacterium]